jgi:hypothetical protein
MVPRASITCTWPSTLGTGTESCHSRLASAPDLAAAAASSGSASGGFRTCFQEEVLTDDPCAVEAVAPVWEAVSVTSISALSWGLNSATDR